MDYNFCYNFGIIFNNLLENSMKTISAMFALLVLASCGTTTRFDQTCITCVSSQRISCKGAECPTSFMVGSDCLVTVVETGENIYLNDILKEEKIAPMDGLQLTLAKVNGRYYISCDSFAKMWYLMPAKKNEACLKSIDMPADRMGIVSFELYDNQLKMISQDKTKEFIFDDNKDKWVDVKTAKVGG